jgi:glutamate-1-semialdehyde 2,1-aminomutase
MRRNLSRSNSHHRNALQKLPLGVSSNFRYWGEGTTLFVARGKGSRLWDIDGNEYIDYRLAYGPAILGYAHPEVDEAARRGMEIGGVFAFGTEAELSVAERISRMVPAAERVRFSNSGTEAVMAALRVARAHTGRDDFVLIEGGYHGVFDAVLWQCDIENWNPADAREPELVPYSQGVAGSARQHVHPVPMNDAERLEDTLRRHGDRIGALLIEPIMGNCCAITARRDFLQTARELCDRYGVVLIVDEVKTGFRVARGGVQELLDVSADLCTFAKAMGNGYPIAALAGRAELMDRIGRGVVHGGTYTAHSVSLAAADKTLELLETTPALEHIAAYGRLMQAGLSRILDARGIAHSFSGHPSMGGLFFSATPPDNYRDFKRSEYAFYEALAPELHDLGIIVEPDAREPWFVSAAHDALCLEQTLARFEQAVDITLDRLGREHAKPLAGAGGGRH